jgi:nucleoid DNA-binding protein
MNEKINLQELIILLAQKSGITKKESEVFLKEFFDIINEALLADRLIKVKNLGTFKLLLVNDRESVDVVTKERVLIPAHYKVNFSADNNLANAINEPFAFFNPVELNEDNTVIDSDETIVFFDDDDDNSDESIENFDENDFELIVEDTEKVNNDFELITKEPEKFNNNFELIANENKEFKDNFNFIKNDFNFIENDLSTPIKNFDIQEISENIIQEIEEKTTKENDIKSFINKDKAKSSEELEILENPRNIWEKTQKGFEITKETFDNIINDLPDNNEIEEIGYNGYEKELRNPIETYRDTVKIKTEENTQITPDFQFENKKDPDNDNKAKNPIFTKTAKIRRKSREYLRWLVLPSYFIILGIVVLFFYKLYGRINYNEGGVPPIINTKPVDTQPSVMDEESTHNSNTNEYTSNIYNDSIAAILKKLGYSISEKNKSPLAETDAQSAKNKKNENQFDNSNTAISNNSANTPSETNPPQAANPPASSNGNKKITIRNGQTLTMLALQEYGNKCFWIYIYEENKEIIKNPNSISAGTIIVIPPAEKYGINKNDIASINKANEKANQLQY